MLKKMDIDFQRSKYRHSTVYIEHNGYIYIGYALRVGYPITEQHRTANIYFDNNTNRVGIEPATANSGHYAMTTVGNNRLVYCGAFLNRYNIERGFRADARIRDIDNKKMIVFTASRSKRSE